MLSLDFFLTSPYLHLAIHDKDDVIAFLGLALCGLLAAALGSPRRERLLAGRQLRLLQAALLEGASAGPVDSGLEQLVDAARGAFPLAAIVVRDAGEAAGARGERRGDRRLRSRYGRERRGARRHRGVLGLAGGRPPADDGRAPAARRGRAPGGLGAELLGDGRPAGNEARRALAALVAAVSMVIDARGLVAEAAAGRPPANPSWGAGGRRRAAQDHEPDR